MLARTWMLFRRSGPGLSRRCVGGVHAKGSENPLLPGEVIEVVEKSAYDKLLGEYREAVESLERIAKERDRAARDQRMLA